jgi:predicted AAA+ superfamily ATPase
MPEIILGNYNEEYIKNYTLNLVDSIILKDIIARYKVSDYKLFEKVLNFLSQNI